MKVMTIVGTRPEIIKLSSVIPELDKYTEHVLVHTGQNYDYELNEIFFEGMGIRKPDIFMNAAGENPAETIGNVIKMSDQLFKEHKPDALLLYGDTNSCLAIISAKRNKIPVFHMEAGNRCFDQRVPEEINRKIVDHLSDINMTITEHARKYLIAEGIAAETVIKVGSSMKEVLKRNEESINNSKVLEDLGVTPKNYFVLSAHREENLDDPKNLTSLVDSINAVAEKYNMPIIFSTHPRTQKKIDSGDIKFNQLVRLMKPLGFADYIKLQQNAFCVISDSGTITEESSLLGFPAITVRQAHERPEGMDEGTVIMSNLDRESVLNSINVVTSQNMRMRIVDDYNNDILASKIVRIILSYTGYINRTVWKKY
ncbi:MAG: UDP-N-acetylglucosamine 2-epimerase, UDP-N-acetylglucosamine 2-epimerase [candidate division WS6 bacterium GW2011_GWC1_33_20]|uniref:UDP-N-acetylglucosamine 2-epimerase n=2 Tax=Candidatus Dojkabacteria TaxID=74243 RepID=A0A0G0ATX1_9BACT|nr:MAG: UDP-N-acetylglucosamine 2-epimerase, UDP-N-acetylglucosamine 2-epimerase [candidate division WS6 bacterium GW2011_GWC1_33_20]KKP44762.1 MAG: UDP-N-acetylglucosamine 2-epimerase, UDP-N-acetylglucosamine 2-epimerase [candidate division WS6 bacterium GW2011_GWF1_33_233]KKP54329.1 MAG: UDP-N-acetylglucosamine 2-epimerase, UDP-N-acetylglucosamine 2-epimerase [candidate division WS6 bacterium GW2011_WS6_33_547]KKP54876.1 MAG: UDP-N-acetylglucosamine 2-epimerase [candidate division WS6 bacteriu